MRYARKRFIENIEIEHDTSHVLVPSFYIYCFRQRKKEFIFQHIFCAHFSSMLLRVRSRLPGLRIAGHVCHQSFSLRGSSSHSRPMVASFASLVLQRYVCQGGDKGTGQRRFKSVTDDNPSRSESSASSPPKGAASKFSAATAAIAQRNKPGARIYDFSFSVATLLSIVVGIMVLLFAVNAAPISPPAQLSDEAMMRAHSKAEQRAERSYKSARNKAATEEQAL